MLSLKSSNQIIISNYILVPSVDIFMIIFLTGRNNVNTVFYTKFYYR